MIEPPINPPESRYLAEVWAAYVVDSEIEAARIVGLVENHDGYRTDDLFPATADWQEVEGKEVFRVMLFYAIEFEYDGPADKEEILYSLEKKLSDISESVGTSPEFTWERSA